MQVGPLVFCKKERSCIKTRKVQGTEYIVVSESLSEPLCTGWGRLTEREGPLCNSHTFQPHQAPFQVVQI